MSAMPPKLAILRVNHAPFMRTPKSLTSQWMGLAGLPGDKHTAPAKQPIFWSLPCFLSTIIGLHAFFGFME
jgi:hypothetical protein